MTGQSIREKYPRFDWVAEWDKTPPAEEWYAYPIAPKGAQGRLVSLASQAKVGKSLLVLEMAACIVTGKPFLGRDTMYGKILYIDFENTMYGDILPRLKDMGYIQGEIDSQIDYLSLPALPPLDSPQGAREFLEILDHYKPNIVIIDTLSRVTNGEENSADTYRAMYSLAFQKAKSLGITIIRLDHTGKDIDRGARGSSAKEGDGDLNLILKKDKDSPNTIDLIIQSTRMKMEEETLHIRREKNPLRHTQCLSQREEEYQWKEKEANRIWDEEGCTAKTSQNKARDTIRKSGLSAADAKIKEWWKRRKAREVEQESANEKPPEPPDTLNV